MPNVLCIGTGPQVPNLVACDMLHGMADPVPPALQEVLDLHGNQPNGGHMAALFTDAGVRLGDGAQGIPLVLLSRHRVALYAFPTHPK
jgi:hypothetical protein